MNLRGSIAVLSFLGLMLAVNAASPPSGFDFTVGPVAAGFPVAVTVAAAPCTNVVVVLRIGGVVVAETQVTAPGVATLNVPDGTQGRGFVIELQCGTSRDGQGGVVM